MKKGFLLLLLALCFMGMQAQDPILPDTLKKHVFFLAGDEMEGRGWATPAGRKAGDYVARHFELAGLNKLGDSYFHPFLVRSGQTVLEGRNVVGWIEGSDPVLKNEFIVLGAHYDHIAYKTSPDGEKIVYNGADDNASGTATVIELGKALMKSRLNRSVILIAFDAEESGLIGSTELVRQEFVPLDQIKVMFSIDMVGRLAESGSVIMGALDDVRGARELLLELAGDQGIKIKRTGGETTARTDTKPFGDAGIPAVYVSSGIVGPYHRPEDDPETLDYEGMAQIANLLADLTVDLAGMAELEPAGVLAKQDMKDGLPFFRVAAVTSLGSSKHHFPNEFYRGKPVFSLDAGLMTQFKITRNLSLQPEVLYEWSGSKAEGGTFRAHRVSTPVSLMLASNMNEMAGQRFFALVGAYYAWQFAGTSDKQPIDLQSVYAPQLWGFTWGFGLEAMSVYVKATFKYSLTNLYQDGTAGQIRDRGAYLTVGYFF